jgi:hypothetical protein
VVKKIKSTAERTIILQFLEDVMYANGCGVDDDPIDWALTQLDIIANLHPRVTAFMKYIKDVRRPKMSM